MMKALRNQINGTTTSTNRARCGRSLICPGSSQYLVLHTIAGRSIAARLTLLLLCLRTKKYRLSTSTDTLSDAATTTARYTTCKIRVVLSNSTIVGYESVCPRAAIARPQAASPVPRMLSMMNVFHTVLFQPGLARFVPFDVTWFE